MVVSNQKCFIAGLSQRLPSLFVALVQETKEQRKPTVSTALSGINTGSNACRYFCESRNFSLLVLALQTLNDLNVHLIILQNSVMGIHVTMWENVHTFIIFASLQPDKRGDNPQGHLDPGFPQSGTLDPIYNDRRTIGPVSLTWVLRIC